MKLNDIQTIYAGSSQVLRIARGSDSWWVASIPFRYQESFSDPEFTEGGALGLSTLLSNSSIYVDSSCYISKIYSIKVELELLESVPVDHNGLILFQVFGRPTWSYGLTFADLVGDFSDFNHDGITAPSPQGSGDMVGLGVVGIDIATEWFDLGSNPISAAGDLGSVTMNFTYPEEWWAGLDPEYEGYEYEGGNLDSISCLLVMYAYLFDDEMDPVGTLDVKVNSIEIDYEAICGVTFPGYDIYHSALSYSEILADPLVVPAGQTTTFDLWDFSKHYSVKSDRSLDVIGWTMTFQCTDVGLAGAPYLFFDIDIDKKYSLESSNQFMLMSPDRSSAIMGGMDAQGTWDTPLNLGWTLNEESRASFSFKKEITGPNQFTIDAIPLNDGEDPTSGFIVNTNQDGITFMHELEYGEHQVEPLLMAGDVFVNYGPDIDPGSKIWNVFFKIHITDEIDSDTIQIKLGEEDGPPIPGNWAVSMFGNTGTIATYSGPTDDQFQILEITDFVPGPNDMVYISFVPDEEMLVSSYTCYSINNELFDSSSIDMRICYIPIEVVE